MVKVGVEGGRMEMTTLPQPGLVIDVEDGKGDLGMHGSVESMASVGWGGKKLEHCHKYTELSDGQLNT